MKAHAVYSPELSRIEKKQKWDAIIFKFESSGLKHKEYCEQYGLKLDDFRYHRSMRKRRDLVVSGFIPVSLALSPKTINPYFKVRLSSEIKVSIPMNFSELALTSLLKILRQDK